MELLPAIDLRAGAAVRLTQGDFAREERYGDPASLAARYIAGGAQWIHVVDLEGARTGVPHERSALAEIVRLANDGDVGMQFGLQDTVDDDAEEVRVRGARSGGWLRRACLGGGGFAGPAILRRTRLPGGRTWCRGGAGPRLARGSGLPVPPSYWSCGRTSLWVRSWPQPLRGDGMMTGPDLHGLRSLLGATVLPVVASGGVATLNDLTTLGACSLPPEQRLCGVVVGKALVEGRARGGGTGGRGQRPTDPLSDVTGGRVVKGVRFVDLTDEGDPVELAARYDAEGADEVMFLDITASSDGARHDGRGGGSHRRTGLHPVDRWRRSPGGRGCSPPLAGRGGQDRGGTRVGPRTTRVGARDRRRVRRTVRGCGDRRTGPRRGWLGGIHTRGPPSGRPRRRRHGQSSAQGTAQVRSC